MDFKEAFKQAIRGEIEGRELYAMAADKVSDAKAKEVFSNLSKEENLHFEYLQKLAEAYFSGQPLEVPKLEKLETFADAQSPIFTREFKEFVKDRHFEVATLSIGIKLELEAAAAYREMAKNAEGEDLKRFFQELAEWEDGHYQALRRQISFLQEYYETKNSLFRF
jgi:rubrerythrin